MTRQPKDIRGKGNIKWRSLNNNLGNYLDTLSFALCQ